MSILYTPAGDTDPIRDMYDGAILQILRRYRPWLIRIFLSKDMAQKENTKQVYSKAIKHVAPECKVEFIKTKITEAQKMEKLVPLAEEFLQLRKEYPAEKILLNLSSGTPQMKTIMSFLATDFENVQAIQVMSPHNGSNRSNHAAQNDEDIDSIIANNLDDEPDMPNRCQEPPLSLFQRYSVRHQLISLVNNYEYSAAFTLYKKYRGMFSTETGRLLEHADLRSKLQLDDAFAKAGKRISNNREVNMLSEYFMLMELRQKRSELAEFIVKLTPFLYQLLLFYFQNKTVYQPAKFCERSSANKPWKIKRQRLQKMFPQVLAKLDTAYGGNFRDNTELSFTNMLDILKIMPGEPQELVDLLSVLREVEARHRNPLAHTIVNITEEVLQNTEPKLGSFAIVQKLRKAFLLVMQGENVLKKNVYEELNYAIIKSMDTFSV